MTVRELIRRGPRAEQVPGSTGPDEVTVRLSRRDIRRRRRLAGWRRRWRSVVAAVLVVALVAAGVWVVLFSPYLTARGVEVVGAGDLETERVGATAQLPDGVPLARVDLDGIRQRVEAVPAVESAEVSRSWPHTVRVQVVPRTPLAVLGAGDDRLAVDAAGVRFDAPGEALAGLPQVEPTGDLATGGDGVEQAVDDALAEVGRVLASLPDDLGRRVVRVRVGSVDEVTLALRSGRSVAWGSAADSATKAEVLAVLLDDLPGAVREIDVTVPGRPTTR